METTRPNLAGSLLVCLGAVMVAMLLGIAIMLLPPEPDPPRWAEPPPAKPREARETTTPGEDRGHAESRRRMVDHQLRDRDIVDRKVLDAMGRVPRHRFVPEDLLPHAYADRPLPIGHGQTISQPYIVALMTQAARVTPGSRVLDIGTGSGYQAAVLGELCREVFSIEIVKPLGETAQKRLASLGYKNITVRIGDGYRGWPEKAPFDAIIVAAAPDHVPQPLVDQLARGGRLVIPVGQFFQELLVIEKRPDGTVRKDSIAPVRFVPMRGEAEKPSKKG